MRRFLSICALVTALGMGSSEAIAQVQGRDWSVITGRTVGTNNDLLFFQAGWPGISASLIHGVKPKLDLGGIFTFNYGFEGDVNAPVTPGLKVQGLLRANFTDTSKLNFGLNFAPGPLFYFFNGGPTVIGLEVPIGLALGIRASPDLNVGLTFELPMFVVFGTSRYDGQLVLPILFGGGIEYFLERNLALTFTLRMGPMIYTASNFTDFDFQALFGLAVKL
jgi:hypothetical protein